MKTSFQHSICATMSMHSSNSPAIPSNPEKGECIIGENIVIIYRKSYSIKCRCAHGMHQSSCLYVLCTHTHSITHQFQMRIFLSRNPLNKKRVPQSVYMQLNILHAIKLPLCITGNWHKYSIIAFLYVSHE